LAEPRLHAADPATTKSINPLGWTNSRYNDYSPVMAGVVLREIRQTRPFRSIEEEIVVGLQLAAHRVLAPWAHILADRARLTPTQYNLLLIVRGAGAGGRTCAEIGERLITRDPDVTRLLARMVRRGLVRRDPDPRDRRAARVRITPRGRALLRRLDPVVAELPARLLGALTRRQLEDLRARLEAAIDSVNRATARPNQE
jgi:DNA-binding MarR family transcriptional regulator